VKQIKKWKRVDRIQRKTPRRTRARPVGFVHQFLIGLCNTDPLVWRRIQVPEVYSFWDLHVAIQDAMGWQDYHLHEFGLFNHARGKYEFIGIPDDEVPDRVWLPGWATRISDYFSDEMPLASYVYDFGDHWRHFVAYEGIENAMASVTYPRCIAGARWCPPEDCGGVRGYVDFVEAIADSTHPEHGDLLQWVGGKFDPDEFAPGAVVFDDPRTRWRQAFQE
jgi:hypothetical protein